MMLKKHLGQELVEQVRFSRAAILTPAQPWSLKNNPKRTLALPMLGENKIVNRQIFSKVLNKQRIERDLASNPLSVWRNNIRRMHAQFDVAMNDPEKALKLKSARIDKKALPWWKNQQYILYQFKQKAAVGFGLKHIEPNPRPDFSDESLGSVSDLSDLSSQLSSWPGPSSSSKEELAKYAPSKLDSAKIDILFPYKTKHAIGKNGVRKHHRYHLNPTGLVPLKKGSVTPKAAGASAAARALPMPPFVARELTHGPGALEMVKQIRERLAQMRIQSQYEEEVSDNDIVAWIRSMEELKKNDPGLARLYDQDGELDNTSTIS
jgi:hypothetical protein